MAKKKASNLGIRWSFDYKIQDNARIPNDPEIKAKVRTRGGKHIVHLSGYGPDVPDGDFDYIGGLLNEICGELNSKPADAANSADTFGKIKEFCAVMEAHLRGGAEAEAPEDDA